MIGKARRRELAERIKADFLNWRYNPLANQNERFAMLLSHSLAEAVYELLTDEKMNAEPDARQRDREAACDSQTRT